VISLKDAIHFENVDRTPAVLGAFSMPCTVLPHTPDAKTATGQIRPVVYMRRPSMATIEDPSIGSRRDKEVFPFAITRAAVPPSCC
jgi:hypothetical protein